MPRLPFRIALFLSSFSPLFALMAFVNRDLPGAFWSLVGAAVLGILGLVTVLVVLSTEDGPSITVKSVTPKDGEVLSYIAVYLVPFLAIDLSDTNGRVLFIGFLIVLCLVYVNSNMLFVNPLLNLIGFHTFEVTDTKLNSVTVITRRRDLPDGVRIAPAQIDRHLRVDSHWGRRSR